MPARVISSQMESSGDSEITENKQIPGSTHEKAMRFGVVELLRFVDVPAIVGQNPGDARNQAGAVNAGKGQNMAI